MIKTLVLSIIITWLAVKIIKTIIDCRKERSMSLKKLFYDGGMPSAHTALVASASTSLFLETGFSPIFALSIVLALIVMNDAMKVRWITQEQSIAINKLTQGKAGFKKMEERVGHTPVEVFVGLILGIMIPVIIYAL
jgi:uncharacterized protein